MAWMSGFRAALERIMAWMSGFRAALERIMAWMSSFRADYGLVGQKACKQLNCDEFWMSLIKITIFFIDFNEVP